MVKYCLMLSLFLSIKAFCFGQYNKNFAIHQEVDRLIDKANKNELSIDEYNTLKNYGYRIQNDGFSLESSKHDYKQSLEQINKALLIWIAMKDTLNEANNRKYKGFLLGRLGRFIEGKIEVRHAVSLFKLKNKDYGIAVSEFDLSKVYEDEGKLDSAIHYATSALTYWKTTKDTSRVLVNNNQVMNLFLKAKNYDQALKIQDDSEPLSKKLGLYWQHYIDFYTLSNLLFDKLNNEGSALKYKTLLLKKTEELKAKGVNGLSNYKEIK